MLMRQPLAFLLQAPAGLLISIKNRKILLKTLSAQFPPPPSFQPPYDTKRSIYIMWRRERTGLYDDSVLGRPLQF